MLSTRLLVFSQPKGMKYDFRRIVRAASDSVQDSLSRPLIKGEHGRRIGVADCSEWIY
jgi:hypothetical protein